MGTLTVADLMSKDLVVLAAEEELQLATEVMELARVRHLPVVKRGKLVGLVTHRDLLRAQATLLAKLDTRNDEKRFVSITASDIMTTGVKTVTPQTPAVTAAEMLLDYKFGCLPVIEGEKMVGIITEADFLGWALRQLRQQEEA